MKLHGYWRSSTTYRVRIALNLKGCAYDTIPVNLLSGAHRDPAYLALNPAGTVPMLEWDGVRYTQSTAIIDLLEERFPQPSLWPDDRGARILCRELSDAIATETHAPNNMRALAWLRTHLAATDAQVAAWVAASLSATLAPVEARLAATAPGAGLPFADPGMFEIMLVPVLYNARRFGLDLSPWPRLVAIDALCRGIDAFARAQPERQLDAPAQSG